MICLCNWIDRERVVAVSFSVAQNGSGIHLFVVVSCSYNRIV